MKYPDFVHEFIDSILDVIDEEILHDKQLEEWLDEGNLLTFTVDNCGSDYKIRRPNE